MYFVRLHNFINYLFSPIICTLSDYTILLTTYYSLPVHVTDGNTGEVELCVSLMCDFSNDRIIEELDDSMAQEVEEEA